MSRIMPKAELQAHLDRWAERDRIMGPPVTGDQAQQIIKDSMRGTRPEDSPLAPYTPTMLTFRRGIDEDIASMPPGTVIGASDL